MTADIPAAAPETLWRCSECGKWSHAKRRPKHHERNVSWDDVDGDDPRLLREEQTGVEPDTGAPEGIAILACGPFDEYRATKVSA